MQRLARAPAERFQLPIQRGPENLAGFQEVVILIEDPRSLPWAARANHAASRRMLSTSKGFCGESIPIGQNTGYANACLISAMLRIRQSTV